MFRVLAVILAIFFCPILRAEVSVLTSNNPQVKQQREVIYPTPQNLAIDDEMLPATSILYIFEICAIGKQAILVQSQQAQQAPAQRGNKGAIQQYKIKNYTPVRKCKDYIGADTPQDKRNMLNTAMREIQVPNRESVSMSIKATLGNPNATFTVKDKALMPYTIPYNDMPKGSVLKKILVNREKIKKFYNFNLPASVYLGSVIQKRFDNHLPIRISFYEEMIGNNQARNFIVFVFNEAEKYTYTPAANNTASDKVYDIEPDFAVQYLK